MTFVKPISYCLGLNGNDKMQYVPILDTLKALLRHDDILSEILNPHQSNDDKIRDACDGKHFKRHDFWKNRNNAIQILLYYDDFTVTKGGGNRHKYSGFYYILGNISPTLRSQLHCIQLAIITKATSIKEHGLGTVMQPLLNDIMTLEQHGIELPIHGDTIKLYVLVLFQISDNLGSHVVGCFPVHLYHCGHVAFVWYKNRTCGFAVIFRVSKDVHRLHMTTRLLWLKLIRLLVEYMVSLVGHHWMIYNIFMLEKVLHRMSCTICLKMDWCLRCWLT